MKLSVSVDNAEDSNGKQADINDSICSVFEKFLNKNFVSNLNIRHLHWVESIFEFPEEFALHP